MKISEERSVASTLAAKMKKKSFLFCVFSRIKYIIKRKLFAMYGELEEVGAAIYFPRHLARSGGEMALKY